MLHEDWIECVSSHFLGVVVNVYLALPGHVKEVPTGVSNSLPVRVAAGRLEETRQTFVHWIPQEFSVPGHQNCAPRHTCIHMS